MQINAVLSMVAFAILVNTTPTNQMDVMAIVEAVPPEDRTAFIRYHLNMGHELSLNKDIAKVRILEELEELPEDFSLCLYYYYTENNLIVDTEEKQRALDVICFDDGTCIDIGDIGAHPR